MKVGIVVVYKISGIFDENEINPITNTCYNSSWIIYRLTDDINYQIMNGRGNTSVYTLKVSKNYPQWQMSLFDFIQFQETYNKNIIIAISDCDYEEAKKYYNNHNYNDTFLRDYEPNVLIHSTTAENWYNIKIDGYLKSWNMLKREKLNWEDEPIGKSLGDPVDFSDYIMFSHGGISSEIVVLSKQNGKITMDQEMQYKTGVRLYFDMKKIAEDGLLVRDGCHLKVKNTLKLNPYLIWVADWESVGLKDATSTPKEFTKLSNDTFNKLFHKDVQTTF